MKNFVETCGNAKFPRYRIKNQKDGYWTGVKWSHDVTSSKLYYRFQDAANELADIELELYKNKSLGVYEARVKVELFGDAPVDLTKLKDYLSDTVRLELTEPAPDESTVHVSINWDELKERGAQRDRTGRSKGSGER